MFKKIFVFLCYSFVVFLSFLLFVPTYSVAQSCNSIDYNKPTIAAEAYHTVGLKKDGTVLAAGYNGYGQTDVSSWTNIKADAVFGQRLRLPKNATALFGLPSWMKSFVYLF